MSSRVFIVEPERSASVIKALNSVLRRKMLNLLYVEKLNINQIAETLEIPQSTCTVNIKILQDAELIITEQTSATKGAQKLCYTTYEEIVLPVLEQETPLNKKIIETEMPIGLYTGYKITSPCGLVSEKNIIGFYDDVESFLNPHRASAQLVWFSSGYLEYLFPKNIPPGSKGISSLSLTAEICSEFPGHNRDWPSDITVWINNKEIGTWTSPMDIGGERGRLTPDWWSINDSQYGYLKTWKISDQGSFIDGLELSNTTLQDLNLDKNPQIIVKIGVKEDATHRGGLNIFGRTFGNYKQGLMLKIELEDNN